MIKNYLTPRNFILSSVLPLLIFSSLLISYPAFVIELLNITPSDSGTMMLRFLGASMLAHSYLNYVSRNYPAAMLNHVFNMNIIALAVATIVSVIAAWQGMMALPGYL